MIVHVRVAWPAVVIPLVVGAGGCASVWGFSDLTEGGGSAGSDAGDSGGSDRVVGDALDDTAQERDADGGVGNVDAVVNDTASEPPPVCTTAVPFQCGAQGQTVTVTPPTQFCLCPSPMGSCYYGGGQYTTPGPCATCGTYTCQCIEAAMPTLWCSSGGTCHTDSTGGIYVVCN
jgi:hypothetical protein